MIRTQVSFDKRLYERAKAAARRQGISLAELCRRGLLQALAREPGEQPWMVYAGVLDGHPGDSATVDAVVYDREAP